MAYLKLTYKDLSPFSWIALAETLSQTSSGKK